VHCGVDGWARPYDVGEACRRLDADVLVLQESWSPQRGPGLADRVGRALGYDVITRPFAEGWLFQPGPDAPDRHSWGPSPWSHLRRIRAIKRQARGASPTRTGARDTDIFPARFEPGTWDLSILTRIPVDKVEVLDLGKLRADPVHREAVALTVSGGDPAGRSVTIVGVHMSHLTDGSPWQYRRLSALLPSDDVIVAGDMNLPGLPLQAMFPRYRRVARGRSWPAWRPLFQGDHILATPTLAARAKGDVMSAVRGSDHLPVRATFSLG
jgi:endonuclease/exonuclease/phosphatase family metal-dependent hydrolase